MSWVTLEDLIEAESAGKPAGTAHLCNALGCYETVVPTPDWKCPSCKTTMRYGHKYDSCPDCGEHAFFVRMADQYRCQCRCKWTDEDRKSWAKSEQERERREKRDFEERKRQSERSRQQSGERDSKSQARNCWLNLKKKSCSVNRSEIVPPYTAPYEFCKHCPKFKEKNG